MNDWPHTDKIPLTAVRFLPIGVQGIDENHQLYGNFIGVQFVFDQALDPTVLAESIDYLILQHPELTGKYDAGAHVSLRYNPLLNYLYQYLMLFRFL